MKALIRNEGETVTQDMGLTFIDWDTGVPLTNPDWFGGPYILVDNFDPTVCEVVSPEDFTRKAKIENLASETVTIDGVTYIRTS